MDNHTQPNNSDAPSDSENPSMDAARDNLARRSGWHKKPGSIAALLLVLAALILISAWLTGSPAKTTQPPTPSPTPLNAPQLAY